MSDRTMILGVFRDSIEAQRCVDALYDRGYTMSDINVMMSDETRSLHYATSENGNGRTRRVESQETLGTEGMAVGGAVGTAVGATVAALAAIGTSLVIPGLNLIVAGPLAAALAGGGAGAVTGGIVGGLVGLGMTEDDAEVYHTALREGGTVVGVTLHDDDDAADVERIMKSCSGERVHRV